MSPLHFCRALLFFEIDIWKYVFEPRHFTALQNLQGWGLALVNTLEFQFNSLGPAMMLIRSNFDMFYRHKIRVHWQPNNTPILWQTMCFYCILHCRHFSMAEKNDTKCNSLLNYSLKYRFDGLLGLMGLVDFFCHEVRHVQPRYALETLRGRFVFLSSLEAIRDAA